VQSDGGGGVTKCAKCYRSFRAQIEISINQSDGLGVAYVVVCRRDNGEWWRTDILIRHRVIDRRDESRRLNVATDIARSRNVPTRDDPDIWY